MRYVLAAPAVATDLAAEQPEGWNSGSIPQEGSANWQPRPSERVWRTTDRTASIPIEGLEQGRRGPLDYPHLLGAQILPPTARSCLPIELALAFVLLGDVLPGVLFHYPDHLLLAYLDPKRRVEPLHGAQRIFS